VGIAKSPKNKGNGRNPRGVSGRTIKRVSTMNGKGERVEKLLCDPGKMIDLRRVSWDAGSKKGINWREEAAWTSRQKKL